MEIRYMQISTLEYRDPRALSVNQSSYYSQDYYYSRWNNTQSY